MSLRYDASSLHRSVKFEVDRETYEEIQKQATEGDQSVAAYAKQIVLTIVEMNAVVSGRKQQKRST